MRTLISFLFASFISMIQVALAEDGHHHHGLAEANIVILENRLVAEWEIPADSLVGFEHAPETAQEKQKIKTMIAKLKQPGFLLKIPAAATCKLDSAHVELEIEGAHSGFHIVQNYLCQTKNTIKQIEFPLVKNARGVEEIEVRIVSPDGQMAGEITRANPVLELK